VVKDIYSRPLTSSTETDQIRLDRANPKFSPITPRSRRIHSSLRQDGER
jgi:hypothetical protein